MSKRGKLLKKFKAAASELAEIAISANDLSPEDLEWFSKKSEKVFETLGEKIEKAQNEAATRLEEDDLPF